MDLIELWKQRISGGLESHGLEYWQFMDGLHKSNIQLNRKVLADLAAFEPATFESLSKIALDVKEAENDENSNKN
jgi:large subunit ribosomal protein L20